MNRERVLSSIAFAIVVGVSTSLPAVAQTVQEPNADRKTIQQPKPSVKTSPTKTDLRTSPPKLEGSIRSTAVDHCAKELYEEIKDTCDRLSQLCIFIPNPSFQTYSSLRGRLNFLNLDWRRSNCQALPISEAIKNDVGAIYSSRIPEASSRCMNRCLDAADAQVSAGNLDTALSQCRSCCDFLPEADGTRCEIQCKAGILQIQREIAERMRDQAKEGVQSAKEQWKEVLRLLREMAEREAAAVRAIPK